MDASARIRVVAAAVTVALAGSLLTLSPVAAASRVTLSNVLSGYDQPVLVTHAGDPSELFIVEQVGRIQRATLEGGDWQDAGVFLDLRSRVLSGGERGLLGLAFHPDYESNGLFYVNFTRRGSGAKRGDTVIAEYERQSASEADPDSRRVVLRVNQPESNHNGGHLAFGPDDLLYVALGDGGGAGDPRGNGQKLRTRLGKLLRIDPEDPDGNGPRRFRVPGSNPRVGKRGNDTIWAWGLRNPWRFSFDRQNGNLWIGDVGQGAFEEVNRSRSNQNGRNAGKGKNYGWSRCEGKRRYPNTSSRCGFGTRPVHQYAHGGGRCSVTGGYVHRGPQRPGWRGLYVAGDFCGRLFVLNGKGKVKLARNTPRRFSSFGEDAAGNIYATDLTNGTVYRVGFQGARP